MPEITMKVKPNHGTRSVIKPDMFVKPPILVENGPTDYLCGNCGTVLIRGMSEPMGAAVCFSGVTYRIADRINIHNGSITFSTEGGPLVIRCTGCGSYNELPQLH